MTRACVQCGKPFEAKRATAKYCGSTCRARRAQGVEPTVAAPAVAPVSPISAPVPRSGLAGAVAKELEAAGRADTFLGAQAIALAGRIDAGSDTGSAVAALSKELRAVMDAALADAPKTADALDELSERRKQKASGA